MLSFCKPLLPCAALLLLIALAGCGGGPNIVEVTGTLTNKGKPVTNAFIYFVPENGRPSWGQTDEQGRFTLNYDRGHDGALIGKHTVSVKFRPVTSAENLAVMRGQRPPLSKDMAEFFNKYSVEKSKVEVVIDKHTKDLKLDWD